MSLWTTVHRVGKLLKRLARGLNFRQKLRMSAGAMWVWAPKSDRLGNITPQARVCHRCRGITMRRLKLFTPSPPQQRLPRLMGILTCPQNWWEGGNNSNWRSNHKYGELCVQYKCLCRHSRLLPILLTYYAYCQVHIFYFRHLLNKLARFNVEHYLSLKCFNLSPHKPILHSLASSWMHFYLLLIQVKDKLYETTSLFWFNLQPLCPESFVDISYKHKLI